MSLNPCPECGKQISDKAPYCPGCGRPNESAPYRFGYEWKSSTMVWGYPLVHVAFGRRSDGSLRVAKGVIAIGQFGIGLITVAQFGIGFLFGFGQFMLGTLVIAQFAGGVAAGGQFAVGAVAVGQMVLGWYGLGQTGFAKYIWCAAKVDMEAVAFFHTVFDKLMRLIGLSG